jgi:hypothetical protein
MARDNPDPKNIIPNDQKRMRNASDRAQGLDSYFKTVEAQVEATAKSRQGGQAQGELGLHSLVITHRFLPRVVESRPNLKVIIPKDASKPDGDAVENGALLSASELHARGHFVNSPSDEAPPSSFANKPKDDGDNRKDKSYRPPKCSDALDDEAPELIYGSNGEEVTSETEQGHELVCTQ